MDLNISCSWCFTNGVELNGEIFKTVILIWSFTCGTEKLIEHKNFLQSTLFWWLDYVSWWHRSMLFFRCRKSVNHLHAKTLYQRLPFWTRTLYTKLYLEITRILNHLLATQHTLWMWVHWHLFWAFEEREKLMSFMSAYRCSYAYSIYSSRRCCLWCLLVF